MSLDQQMFCKLWSLFFHEDFDRSIPPHYDSLIHSLIHHGLILPLSRKTLQGQPVQAAQIREEKAPYFYNYERCLEAYLQLIGQILQACGYVLLELRLANGWGGLTVLPREQMDQLKILAQEIKDLEIISIP